MPKFNDLDLKNWKEIDLNMDSLWVIPERKKGGKHSNFYHGNFIPQIPEHFIKRYTKKCGCVFDPFLGSATTAIETESLGRNIVGVDIQEDLIKRANELIGDSIKKYFLVGDSGDIKTRNIIKGYLETQQVEGFDLAILHPPYADIIKFSGEKEDLSNCKTIDEFLDGFEKVLKNTYNLLKGGGYCVIVIGDKYQNSEWIPLGFKCMERGQKIGFKLKSIIVKNMEGNRGKYFKTLFKPIEKEEIEVPKEIKLLTEKRWEAKENKDFATADKLRDELLQKGWKVLDKKEGY